MATGGKPTRRGLLAGAASLAAGYAALRGWTGRQGGLAYEPYPGVPGFRQVAGGEVTRGAGGDPFVGLQAAPSVPAVADADICAALFPTGAGPGVPVASFSDYYCPYCRVLTQTLATREETGAVRMSWHELPVLGGASEIAARAAMAAGAQGAYAAFHRRLMRAAFLPTDPYLAELARGLGLDPDRFFRDMDSDAVSARLRTSRAVANRFGFFATPSLVIGRTVVVGMLSEARLDALVAAEAADPGGPCAA